MEPSLPVVLSVEYSVSRSLHGEDRLKMIELDPLKCLKLVYVSAAVNADSALAASTSVDLTPPCSSPPEVERLLHANVLESDCEVNRPMVSSKL